MTESALFQLREDLEGDLFFDLTTRRLYATDASAYRQIPLAVAIPKSVSDLQLLVHFARENNTSIIPRTAGTSLAGQVVGGGIVVDVSKHFNHIQELNEKEHWVRVQPGVIRDDLNQYLKPFGLYFGPETSTANRAMIGGMVGNNSCGSNSIVYGSTREHLLSVKAILSNGSVAEFTSLNKKSFEEKCKGINVSSPLEQNIYMKIRDMLSDPEAQDNIEEHFPKKNIPRRNTGYALDLLMDADTFDRSSLPFNFCKLLAGSEGTLALITDITLNLEPLPPAENVLVCIHFENIYQALEANLIAIKYKPQASELIDHYILECTKNNIEQRKNRFFIEGDPGAVLVVDLSNDSREEAFRIADAMIEEMKEAGLGYHFPILTGQDTKKIWQLRKAGLGLLSNMPGDPKPVPVIEDTAVDVQELPAYIRDFNKILKKHNLYSVHYAHAGSGELHLRPILNLKNELDTHLFRTIAEEIAVLVKKYKGSLSGEHGDGRLRGEFIRYMVGEKNYTLFEQIKKTWDPDNIFNPGKIVDTPPMDTSLRYAPDQETPQFNTTYSFDEFKGYLRAAELCNGSGDCRKSHLSGGTMCPSYMATRNEKDTTRARANILRELLSHPEKKNPFDSEEILDVLDLCLMCKGCKSECPSNVDMARLKGEFLQQYYDIHGVSLRSFMIGHYSGINAITSGFPAIYNFMIKNRVLSGIIKQINGFAQARSLPALHPFTLKSWYKKNKASNFGFHQTEVSQGKVYLFCDEFTNYNDVPVGIASIRLLTSFGFEVEIPDHLESGRALLSKGMLKKARKIALKNIEMLAPIVSEDAPLIGIEPSAILSFKDEYPNLAGKDLEEKAQQLASNTYLIDEFIDLQLKKGIVRKEIFGTEKKRIKLHGHCHQKALASVEPSRNMLSYPENYTVEVIPTGCCGMAGSFGYEKEHYKVSMQIGELVLFPEVRKLPEEVIIAAPGTSCRHQIKDGTGREAKHPIEILWEAMISTAFEEVKKI